MTTSELKDGHYYKAICDDVIKVFKAKEQISKELELSSDCVFVSESIVIIRNSININTWSSLVIDSNYTIDEIDEKDFYSMVKLFTVAKGAILSIVKR